MTRHPERLTGLFRPPPKKGTSGLKKFFLSFDTLHRTLRDKHVQKWLNLKKKNLSGVGGAGPTGEGGVKGTVFRKSFHCTNHLNGAT